MTGVQTCALPISHRKGLPPGHAEVLRELVVPVFSRDRIVAILGVGNKPTEYAELDVETVTSFARMAWVVTEQKRTQAALIQSETRFRSLFDSMNEGAAYCKMLFEDGEAKDWVYLEVNAAFGQLTGLKGVAGKRVSEVIPGIRDSDPDLFAVYGRVALTGIPEKFESFVEAIGIWFVVSVYSPQAEHFVAVFDNITERKRSEAAIQKANEAVAKAEGHYRDIFAGALEGIYRTSLEGRCLAANPALAKMLGYESAEEVVSAISDSALQVWVDPNERGRCTQLIEEQGSVRDFESHFKSKDGKVTWVSLDGRKVCGLDGQTLYYDEFIKDITERK